jgi:hypothetical protein
MNLSLNMSMGKPFGLTKFPGTKTVDISTLTYSSSFCPSPKPSPTDTVSGQIELYIDSAWITSPDGFWGSATKARIYATNIIYSSPIVEVIAVIGGINYTFTVNNTGSYWQQLFFDDYNRAAGVIGPNYDVVYTYAKPVINASGQITAAGDGVGYAKIIDFSGLLESNQRAQIKYISGPSVATNSTTKCGLLLCVSVGGRYIGYYQPYTQKWSLIRQTNTGSTVQTFGSITGGPALVEGDIISMDMVDGVLSLRKNGEVVLSAADATTPLTGTPGVYVTSNGGNYIVLDDFSFDYLTLPFAINHGSGEIADFEVPDGYTNTGLAYDSVNDTLWNGDYTNSKVWQLNKYGAVISSFSVTGTTSLQGVTYDTTNDTLWVTCNARILNLTKYGFILQTITLTGLTLSSALVRLPDDTLLVGVNLSNILRKISIADGSEVGTITIAGITDSAGADGCAYDTSDGTLWVTQNGSSSIVHANIDGTTIDIFDNPAPGDQGEGICIDTVLDILWYSADDEYHSAVPNGNRIFPIGGVL